jgi:hypothetical protein
MHSSTLDFEDDAPPRFRRRNTYEEDFDEEEYVAPPPLWKRPWVGVAAAGVATLVTILTLGGPRDASAAYGIKGPELQVSVQRQGHLTRVENGARLVKGDTLRFAVDTARYPYLLIVSLDGAGTPDIYFPYMHGKSGLVRDGHVELPDGVTVDNSRGPVRLFAFFSNGPFSTNELYPALEQLSRGGPTAVRDATDGLPVAGGIQRTFYFEKN